METAAASAWQAPARWRSASRRDVNEPGPAQERADELPVKGP